MEPDSQRGERPAAAWLSKPQPRIGRRKLSWYSKNAGTVLRSSRREVKSRSWGKAGACLVSATRSKPGQATKERGLQALSLPISLTDLDELWFWGQGFKPRRGGLFLGRGTKKITPSLPPTGGPSS